MTRFSAVLVLLVLSGCLPIIEVHVRTRVLEDGTALRDTHIVKIRRDANSDAEKEWNSRPLAEDLGRGITEGFASTLVSDDEIRMSGVFADPTRIPADFRRDVELVGDQARNAVDFRMEDILIGTRYLYRERFVDAIPPEDQKEARRELIALCTRFVRAAARHEFGRAYDLAAFNRYVDEDLGGVLEQLIEVYWSERKKLSKADPHTGETGLQRALERAERLLERFGLPLSADLGSTDNALVVKAWLTDLLAAKLTPRVEGAPAPRPADFAYLFSPEEPWAGLRIAAERAAEIEFGSVDAAERAFRRALLGVTGTFGSPPAEAEFRFDCAVEMPGLLLRTNGFLEGERAAFWLFQGEDIFPNGVTLELESVVLRPEGVGAIRELRSGFDRRDAVRLIQALEGVSASDRERMKQLLARCAAHGTLDALAGGDDEQQALVRRLEPVLEVLRR